MQHQAPQDPHIQNFYDRIARLETGQDQVSKEAIERLVQEIEEYEHGAKQRSREAFGSIGFTFGMERSECTIEMVWRKKHSRCAGC